MVARKWINPFNCAPSEEKGCTLKKLVQIFIGCVCAAIHANAAPCVTSPSGLIGWWSGDYVARDRAGTNHGVLQNSAAYGAGIAGPAFSLNGSGYISAPDSPQWAFGTNQFTIELWANFAANNGDRTLVANDTGGGTQDKWIFYLNSGVLKFHINGSVGNANIGSAPFVPTLSQWYHLAVTRQSSNYTFFINGNPVSTNIDTRAIPDANALLTIGNAEGGFYFSGLLDEVSIYDRALGAAEVQSIYNAGSAGKCFAPAPGATVPYFTDFESGVSPFWSDARWETTQPTYFTRFSGRYENSFQTLTLTNLTPGQSYTLTFDFYPIDSWDGNPDTFYVGADGVQLLRDTFSNYNGNPPGNPQTFPRGPDEGRAAFGFEPSYVDAIYRGIRLNFVPSNTVAILAFAGQSISPISDESWGIDNVRVQLTTDAVNTIIHSTTLPPQATTNTFALDTFIIAASRPLLAATANNAANYSLREAGGNGTLGDGDDVILSITPSFTSGQSVTLTINAAPLQPGFYRFQTTTGLQDTNGGAVTAFTRDFTIAHPVLGKIENTSNGTLGTATALSATESPSGSGLFTTFAAGSFSSTSDVDFWRFDAEAGDRLTVRLESEFASVSPQLQLQNASGGNLGNGSSSSSVVGFQNYTFATPGTYYLRVLSTSARSRYEMRVDIARGTQSESEANDTPGTANALTLAISPGLYQGKAIGALPSDDSAGDYFALGTLNVGNPITAFLQFPTGAVLNANNTTLKIYLAGNNTALATNTTGNLNYTVVSNGIHYVRVESTNRFLRAHYVVTVAISDGVPPAITATTLPAESAVVTAIIDRLALTFSEDLVPASVSNAANYELRSAGADGSFNTSDDVIYSTAVAGYNGGLTADYSIPDGPLQTGAYRFTARTNLIDRASNPMAAPFIRNFIVTNVPGFVLETRLNDTIGRAGSISATPTTTPDGTFSTLAALSTGDGPEGIVSGDFDHDGDRDVVVVNYNGNTINVLRNDGRGSFQSSTNIPSPGSPIYVAAAHLNGDTNLDLIVAHYNGNGVSVLLGDASGNFQIASNYTGFNRPHYLATGDFNKDGQVDVAVPNYNGGNISVMLGNGDGTFQPRTNYVTGTSPFQVAVGDINNDTHADLAVANYSSDTVSLFLGSATGVFQLATNLPVGPNPRSVAINDVSGDISPDLIVLQPGDNTVSVFVNNGNGTFQVRRDYATGTSDAYQLTVLDLNADGRKDIVVPGYGNDVLTILFNDGAGRFTNTLSQSLANGPICTAVEDFTGDSVLDLVITRYHSDAITLLAGNAVNPLAESPTGSSLRSAFGRGNLSSTADPDYFKFTGNAGDRAYVAVETVGSPVNSSLHVELQRFDGGALTTFNSDNAGHGQSAPVVLPYTGTYLVRITYNNDYQGEYRFRVTTVAPPTRIETEANNTVAQANPLSLTLSNGHLIASMAAYISAPDPGDFYSLGHVAAGTTIALNTAQPSTSGFATLLSIHNSAGNIVASGIAGATNLAFIVPVGQGGPYYARVAAGSGGYSTAVETAIRFDGSDDYIDLGNWFNYQTFTISMWLNPGPSQQSFADIIDNNHTGSRSWVLQYANTATRFGWGTADGSPTSINIDFNPNQWQHLAITRDSANVNRVYVNGTLIGTVAGTGEIFYDGTQFLRLSRWGGGGRHWNGLLDDLRVWNRALTPAEIAAGMTGTLTGTEPGLAGYWPFNEGTGTSSADLSPSNHLASLINGATWTSLSTSNAQRPGLLAQYNVRFDITDAQGPTVVNVSLPAEGASSTALVNQFDVIFDEEISTAVNAANRVVHSYNGHYYLLTDNAGSWQEAEAQAVALGGHLVTINDPNENTFLTSAFGSSGTLWMGFNDNATEGAFSWISGEPVTFTFWNGGEPNNNANEDYGQILSSGRWNDAGPATLRGIVEVTQLTDTDGDGLANVLDPFPSDAMNGFELRSAGADATFGTSDDARYDLNTAWTGVSAGYAGGTNVSFFIPDGPLQPGQYRFTVSTSIRDRFGNAMAAPYARLFTVTNVTVPGAQFVIENRNNNSPSAATSFSGTAATAPDGSLAHLNTYGVGSNPYFVIAAAFNQDTNADLLVANYGSDSLSILYGTGNGLFTLPTNFPVGNTPIGMALGDFVGNTNKDVAVALYNANQVAIVENDGAGNFQVRSNYTVGTNPRAVITGDFNADGFPDLATANAGGGAAGNSVSVLLGNASRTFNPRVDYPLGAAIYGIAAGDVNRDGKVDLIAANYGAGTINVLLGLGNGSFTNTNSFAIGPNPRPVALADLNGDTNLDLVTFTTGDDRLRVAFGNGDGSFQTNTQYAINASDVYQLVPSDLNLDGRPDVIVPAYGGNRLITLLTGADGSLSNVITYNPGGSPIGATVADFNHDGRPDIATANYSGHTIHVFLGNGSGVLAENPPGSGVRDALARGSLWDGNEVDYWSFTGNAGDRLSVAIETVGSPAASSLQVFVDRPDGQLTSFVPDYTGWGQMRTTLPVSGTYVVRVQPWYNFPGEYRLRVTLAAPPTEIESEDNGTINSANALTYVLTPGHQSARVLGYLNLGDANGDYFQLGNQTAGTTITLGLRAPGFSTVVPTLTLYRTGGVLATNSAAGTTNLVYTIPPGGDGAYYTRVTSTVRGLLAEYILDLDVADTQPPTITDTTLPLEGTNIFTIFDRFSLTFSEDMLVGTITNPANYELRSAGADNLFSTSDDQLYTIQNSPVYAIGLTASYLIPDGPLQPGAYRFTAATNLADRPGLQMAAAFVRSFVVSNVASFTFESRNNNSVATAGTLSFAVTNRPDGSLSVFSNIVVQNNPYYCAAGHLNADTNLDLVVANFGGDSVSVLLGNGLGAFTLVSNYTGNSSAIAPVLGYFNTDSNLDLALLNYSAASLRVYFGNGDGTFIVSSNYSVGSQPHNLALGDFNADGRPDIAVANYNSDSISVLIGLANGTFQGATNYPAGDGPIHVAVGDVNGDNKLDVLSANDRSDNLSLFLGNGNGTFAPALAIAVNSTPRAVVLRDLNNDGKLDLAVGHAGENTMAVLLGNGDGSFQTRVSYGSGTSDSYDLVAVDFNNDGWLDLAMSGYGNSRFSTFLNRKDGTFEPASTYVVGNRPIGIVAADFNMDGRQDVVLANYSGASITVLLGNDTEPLPTDSSDGSIFIGRARGSLFNDSDADYFSFTATAGSRIAVATEVVGAPISSGFHYYIFKPDSALLFEVYADYSGGRGEGSAVAPVSGTYYLAVAPYWWTVAEYNVRVSVLPGTTQMEVENNNGVGSANTPTFAVSGGHQRATLFGFIASDDSAGDYYRLGNLTAGTVVSLQMARPPSSTLAAVLGIYNASGALMTNAPAGTTNLAFTVGTDAAYFARVSAAGGSGVFGTYLLAIDLFDAAGPAIVDVTLPPAGTTNAGILDRFTVTVNKDLNPAFIALNRAFQFYNGNAYFLTDNSIPWLAAQLEARSFGGYLVTINDAAENDWVMNHFAPTFWIGLTDEAQEGNYVWASGQAVTYTNWNGGEPNNSGNEDYASMVGAGRWNDVGFSTSYRGLVEVNGADADGDGLPDLADTYPNDPLNLFDLRASGGDGIFDTGDDQVYRLLVGAYTSGLTVGFSVADGPLQPGNYRFRVTTSLRDRFGNGPAGNFDRFFSVTGIPHFGLEDRDNNAAATATALAFVEDPLGVRSAGGRGKIADNADFDFWGFSLNAGDVFMLATDVPGNPGASQLQYNINRPDGSVITTFYPAFTGEGQSAPIVAPSNGTYTVRVDRNYNYYDEYRIRVIIGAPPFQLEAEANESIAAATPLNLAVSGETRFANVAGYVRSATDLDYFSLGTVTNGSSIFLNVRLPAFSTLSPVVSIYNSANQYQTEAGSGRPNDGVAEVRVTQTGTFYAVVRGTDNTSGLTEQYVLDVQVVPTGSVSFPNMQVTAIGLPTGGGIQSGQPITFNFTIENVGSLATPGANWIDRAVMSLNTTLGDADDIPLGFFPHNGALASGQSYSMTNTSILPDGISGNYYIIVQTDAGNAVNEFLLEGDNITVSGATFPVALAPYPDLTVASLNVAGPVSNVYTATWVTTNRGTATAPAGFKERFFVRNTTSGAILVNTEATINNSLPAGGMILRTNSFTATNSGNYIVQITPDSQDQIFEFDAVSHASAEQNTATANFSILQFFNVSVQSSPLGAGTLSGSGNYPIGTIVTVTAAANTNTLPYQFVNWTEGGTFQSSSTNYAFTLTRDRTLIANFTLPSFQVSASNNPPAGGTVSGQGTFFYGTTNLLVANANPGYRFTNWTQIGSVVETSNVLTTVVTSNRFVVANYVEANTFHVVTTATSPTNVTTVAGAGTFNNGQQTTIGTPLSVTNQGNRYTFREYRLNGAFAGNSASFIKTFSTLDPTNMQFVAVYDVTSVNPVVLAANAVVTNTALGGFSAVGTPAPAMTNLQLSIRFDRSMNTNVTPLIVMTNGAPGAAQPSVGSNGVWFATTVSNDTYRTRPITLGPGMDGTNRVRVSLAADLNALVIDPTNVLDLLVDVTPPVPPVISLTASNDTYATFSWNGYVPPSDLNGFRVYLATSNFSSVADMAPVSGLPASSRLHTYFNLSLDQQYYAAVAAVDVAGNSATTLTPVPFRLARSIPPAVAPQVAATDSDSAQVTWSYNTVNLLGFGGFWLFYETNSFTSVVGLTPKQTFGTGIRSAQVNGLDRTRTYYFAIVGFNTTNGNNPSVTTATWSDPYAGNITANLTLGGAGQTVVDVLQTMTILNNAVLTVPAGTTVRFAAGAGIVVQQGRITANGTALDPIVFTSIDDPGNAPAAGSWNGIRINSGGGASLLRHAFINYGAGLVIDGASPTVDAFSALYNQPAGLTLNNATLTTSDALIANNDVGVQQNGTALLNVRNSVLKNNNTNALASGAVTLVATGNWWGTTVSGDIDATLQGPVNRGQFLSSEPLLTPALGTSNNVTQVGTSNINLRLACRTAESMRLSEDSAFTSVFFSPFSNANSFALSPGGGQKTVYAQFRSITGQTSTPVSVAINYITAGPAIASFNLAEGEVLTRPTNVTGSASAPLGMAAMEFYVNNVLQATQAGGGLSYLFDVRPFSNAIYRVKLLARDTADHFATLERNVTIAPTPPPAPAITSPATDFVVGSNTVNVSGTAEPLIAVRILRNAAVVASGNAAANGTFAFSNVPLVEGDNVLVAQAFDLLGSADSNARNVVRDSGPPSPVIMEPASYSPSLGLAISWHYADYGERPAQFVLFWHTAPFTTTNGLAGSVATSSNTIHRFNALPGGAYYFAVVGFDLAGNPSALSERISFNHDPNPPSFAINFDKSSPVGVGLLRMIVTSSEPLAQVPSLTLRTANSTPASLFLSNSALNTFEGFLNVTPSTPSGLLDFAIAGRDVAGNVFNGDPIGPLMVIDVQPPTGLVTTAPIGPVQTTNNTDVSIGLLLSEPAKPGTVPQLSFNPPTGSAVPIVLSGTESNWNGTLTLTPAMGSGFGTFSLTVTDALNNVGHLITAGDRLEIYNTTFPSPPGQPVGFQAMALAAGEVRLNWNAVSNAEIYSLYREPGTNQFARPTVLVASGITSNSFVDLPPTDGPYRFAVTASRRGAEGTNSITRVATSDRLPPPAPTNVIVSLTASGVQVTWLAGVGETPAKYNVYRNGTLIRTVTSVTPVSDAPPRGVINYTVGAADLLGNEALSTAASIELFVGAVNNLVALVNVGQAPQLTWGNSDATAVGYNIYRNGIKQNLAPVTLLSFVDSLGVPPGGVVNYSVRALNATNAESAPRVIDVYDVRLALLANFSGGAENALVNRWFDKFHVIVSNLTTTASFPIDRVELRRVIGGEPTLNLPDVLDTTIGGGNWIERDVIFPAAGTQTAQNMRVQAIEETDIGGSKAIYQTVYDFTQIVPPGIMIDVVADQQPLAGGLATLNLTVFNKGYADIDLLMNRNGGSEPGDLFVSVKNSLGQEVSRLDVRATPPGQIFSADGRGFLRIVPGGSTTFAVSGILVPEALGTNTATFDAVFPQIYYRLGSANQVVSGPLSGSMSSSLAVTPYYGTAQTDRNLYADEDPVQITGQAIDRQSGLPKPNAALKIGFFIRGYKFYYDVVTDTNGNYTYTYNPPQGLSGTFKIWAAHPDVFDILNQAEIKIYRSYLSPSSAEIRLTKNDRLPFTLRLINPGDETLSGFTLESQVFTLAGTNRIPNTNVTMALMAPTNFSVGGRETERVPFEITATIDAPDNVMVEMTLRSAQGAGAKFVGNVSLLPANPILTVIDPPIGYVDLSVNRGSLLSKSVTIVNRGLRDLKGVTLEVPTNVTWITVNLPIAEDGKIHMPDIPVGLSNSFTIVFSPPTNAALEYFQDKIVMRGTNLAAGFNLNVFALVTSSERGNFQFFVDNILAQPVPNANVRIKNTLLQQEYVAKTDANGYVTISDLQEGPWAWQASASGHATRSGVDNIVANQTVQVSTRLAKSLVTVNFSVVPVPFTDRYEIVVEQTFETHVPAPVLVVDPPLVQFHEITSPFEATFIARVKNEGLIQMTDCQISGGYTTGARLVPLINYFPILRAQETVEVPFRFVFDDGSQNATTNGTGGAPSNFVGEPKKGSEPAFTAKSLGPQIDENGNITPSNIQFPENYGQPNQGGNGCTGGIFDLDNFFGAVKAIISACAQCVDAATLNAVVSGLQTAFDKAKDKGKFDYWKVIETVVQIYELLGCPGGGIGGGGGGGGGSSGDGGPGTFTQYGGGGPACFAAGTEVLMADGSRKPIEQIKVGDKVRTGTHKTQVATVAEVLNREVQHTYQIHFAAGGVLPVSTRSADSSVQASAEHLFWVDGEGWVAARNLKPGQWLFTAGDERVRIDAIHRIDKPARVYTFGNHGDNVLYANNILVRDSCGDKAPYFKKSDPQAAEGAARIRASIAPGGLEVAR